MLGSLLRRTAGGASSSLRTLRSSCTTTSFLPKGWPLGLYYCPKSPPTLVPLFLGAGSPDKLARGFATDSTAPTASSSSSSTSSGSSSASTASSASTSTAGSSSGGSGSSSGDTTTSSEPSRQFEGASASDSFASVAHAGFERGSEGRFGYSRRLAANWDRIFGKKNGNAEQPDPQTNGTAAQTNGTNLSSSATANNTKQADLNQIFGKKVQHQQAGEDTQNLEAILKSSSGLPAHLKDSLLKLNAAEFEVLLNVLETARSSNGQRDVQKH